MARVNFSGRHQRRDEAMRVTSLSRLKRKRSHGWRNA